jgi:hypothetical protein
MNMDDVSKNYSCVSMPEDEDATINSSTYPINEESGKLGLCKN